MRYDVAREITIRRPVVGDTRDEDASAVARVREAAADGPAAPPDASHAAAARSHFVQRDVARCFLICPGLVVDLELVFVVLDSRFVRGLDVCREGNGIAVRPPVERSDGGFYVRDLHGLAAVHRQDVDLLIGNVCNAGAVGRPFHAG